MTFRHFLAYIFHRGWKAHQRSLLGVDVAAQDVITIATVTFKAAVVIPHLILFLSRCFIFVSAVNSRSPDSFCGQAGTIRFTSKAIMIIIMGHCYWLCNSLIVIIINSCEKP